MKYGIVAFPSKKLQDLANSYRKRYDPHYELITPHMTLKGVFEANEEEIETVAKEVAEVTKKFNAFPLKVVKFSSFAPVTNAIYLKVEPADELQALHQALNNENFFGGPPEHAFVPHITIAQKLSSGEHDDILGQIKMSNILHEEVIDRIHLLYQFEDGSWTVYDTFRLAGEE